MNKYDIWWELREIGRDMIYIKMRDIENRGDKNEEVIDKKCE